MFDQIADPDGSNYPRLRQLIWGAIDQQASALTKRQQSQALSVLTYTTLVTAVACAAADAMRIGNEGQGVSEDLKALQHRVLTIPRKGTAESLNAAVSASILLAELFDF